MSYSFAPDRGYRMPTHFGPIPGPRQAPAGGPHPVDEGVRATIAWASFAADSDQVAAVLPAGFEPSAEPDVTVEIKNMTNIGWLAGRGYSVATVTTGIRWTGAGEPVDGRFKLVLWENAADPIITGREELGYPKLYAEIPELRFEGDTVTASASWDGFTFLELAVTGLVPDAAALAPAGPSYHLKFIPRAGTMGEHDLNQVILTPPGQGPLRVAERLGGDGTAAFTTGTWQQLPTLVSVVDGLAALTLGPCIGAGLLRTEGGTDLAHQVIVTEA